MVKIGPVDPEIICVKGFIIFKQGVYIDDLRKLQGYWTDSHQICI